jgi:hypothetical protein
MGKIGIPNGNVPNETLKLISIDIATHYGQYVARQSLTCIHPLEKCGAILAPLLLQLA